MKGRGWLLVLMLGAVVIAALYVFRTGGKSIIETQVESLSDSKKDLTAVNMKTVSNEVLSFMSSEGRTPIDFREMQKLQRFAMVYLDSWGRVIRYERLSDTNFRLASAGPDGTFETDDDIELEY